MLSDPQVGTFPPASPNQFIPPISRWTSWGGVALVGTFVMALGSAAVFQFDSVVRAAAIVRPVGDVQVIEAQMEGTISSLPIQRDQAIQAGEVVATLENTALQTQIEQRQTTLQNTQQQLTQLNDQLTALAAQILAEERVINRLIDAATADLRRIQRLYDERLVTTQSDYVAAQAELEQAEAALANAEAELEFAILDQQRYEQLSEDGAVTQRDLDQRTLAVEAQRHNVEGQAQAIQVAQSQLKRYEAALNPITAEIDIAQQRVQQEQARGEATLALLDQQRQELQQRQLDLQTQRDQTQQELQQFEAEAAKAQVRAPTDGTVLQVNVRNSGQVVRPGDPIAQLLPSNANLEVIAQILTQDIGRVNLDQTVKLRVSAYPYPDYGILTGQVTAISDDVIVPPSDSTSPYYEVVITLDQPFLERQGRQFLLQPGMDARADIITDTDTVLRYLLRKARLLVDL